MEAWLAGVRYTPEQYGKSRRASPSSLSVPFADHVDEQQLEFKRNPICYERGGSFNEDDRPTEADYLFLD